MLGLELERWEGLVTGSAPRFSGRPGPDGSSPPRATGESQCSSWGLLVFKSKSLFPRTAWGTLW